MLSPEEHAEIALKTGHRQEEAKARLLEADAERRELINTLLPQLAKDVEKISESLEKLADLLLAGRDIGY